MFWSDKNAFCATKKKKKKKTICYIFIIKFRSGRNSAFVQQYEDEKRNTSEWNISHSEYPVQWSLWLPLCFASTITRYANVCTYLMLCVVVYKEAEYDSLLHTNAIVRMQKKEIFRIAEERIT